MRNEVRQKDLEPFWSGEIDFPSVDRSLLNSTASWEAHLELARRKWSAEQGTLPKDTLLFHGSDVLNPVANLDDSTNIFFFGLDAYIAIWYALESAESGGRSDMMRLLESEAAKQARVEVDIAELEKGKWTESEKESKMKNYNERLELTLQQQGQFLSSLRQLGYDGTNLSEIIDNSKSKGRRYYFLNVYKTIKPLEYIYLDDGITEVNPHDVEACQTTACIHPQFGYHGNNISPPVELSVEMTIPTNNVADSVKFVKALLIDVDVLRKNAGKTYNDFKATDALIDLCPV